MSIDRYYIFDFLSATVAQTGSLRRPIRDPSVRHKPFRALLSCDQCPIEEAAQTVSLRYPCAHFNCNSGLDRRLGKTLSALGAKNLPYPARQPADAFNNRIRSQSAVRDAQVASINHPERVARYRRHAVLFDQSFDQRQWLQLCIELQKEIERAVGRRNDGAIAERRQLAHDHLADRSEAFDLRAAISCADSHRAGRSELRDDRRADQDRVLNLVDRLEEMFGDDHPPDAPARETVGLRKRIERDCVSAAPLD